MPEDVYAIVFQGAEDDFLWRCDICGQSGRGSKSEAKHVKRAGSHGLKNIHRYLPETRVEVLRGSLRAAQAEVAELQEQIPPEGTRVLDDDELRHVLARFANASYIGDLSLDENPSPERFLDHQQWLIWNDDFWRGFTERLADEGRRYAEDIQRHKLEQEETRRSWRMNRIPQLREELAELEAEEDG